MKKYIFKIGERVKFNEEYLITGGETTAISYRDYDCSGDNVSHGSLGLHPYYHQNGALIKGIYSWIGTTYFHQYPIPIT